MVTSPTFQKGWNAGVKGAAQAILNSNPQLSKAERSQFLRVLQPLLIHIPSVPLSDSQMARKYGISKRTVLNWRKDGCPFPQGQRAVLDWMAGRRYLPAKAERKFKRQLARRRLRAMFTELDNAVIETQALAKVHRELGLPVEPWMRLRRLTRRKGGAMIAEAKAEILRRLEGLG